MGTLNHYRHCNSFADAARLYESIEPLKGKWTGLDVRPLSGRSRMDMRIIKREGEYIITDDYQSVYHLRSNGQGKPSLEQLRRMEKCIVFTPDDEVTIYHPVRPAATGLVARDFPIGNFCFVDRFLPSGMSLVRHDGKVYVQLEPHGKHGFRQYLVHRLEGLRFKQVRGGWKCLNPVAEVKKTIDRRMVNAWRRDKMEAYVADVLALYVMIDDATLQKHQQSVYARSGTNPDALAETLSSGNPFDIALEIKKFYKFGCYPTLKNGWNGYGYGKPDPKKVGRMEVAEEESLRAVIHELAVYAGHCFKVEDIPIGEVCLNSRYRRDAVEVPL